MSREVDAARERGGWARSEGLYFSHDKINLLHCFLHSQMSILSPRTLKSRFRKEVEGPRQDGVGGWGHHLKENMINWLGDGGTALNVSMWLKPSAGLGVS